tara:strand:- start:11442 stop:12479 length:1038 start_codon:yes stop_codon:yes gene_type:complete
MPWKVDWRVEVDGVDMTTRMRPYLTSIEVTDRDGSAGDTCSLEFDDSDGQLKLPKDGAKVEVWLNHVSVFAGTVDSVRSRGAKQGGRTLSVGAKGFDSRSKVKEPLSFHLDDDTLQAFLDKAARHAGLSGVSVSDSLAGIARDYWSAEGESFLHLGQRLARELGATFKIRGDRAVMKERGDGKAPSGTDLPTVVGLVGLGSNVINWDISPFKGRSAFRRAKVRYFDREEATFREEEVDFELERDGPDATNAVRVPAADQAQAREQAAARKRDAERDTGGGSVELDLVETAYAEADFVLIGTRPGIDGTYRISSRTHRANKNGGAVTSLDIKQPGGGAGKDEKPRT